MEPNDLPLERSGDAAEKLIDLRYPLTEARERHYGGLLISRVHQIEPSCPPQPPSPATDDTPP